MSATAFQRRRREQAAKAQKKPVTESIEQMTYQELKALAKEKGIEGYSKMKKAELIAALAGE